MKAPSAHASEQKHISKKSSAFALKIHIQRIFLSQEDVCVLYNIDTAGITNVSLLTYLSMR
jgi:hypothetical protein